MERQNIIQEYNGPTQWMSPLHIVKKKTEDGQIKLRPVIGLRMVNSVTKRSDHPLPHLNEILDSLGGNSWWCMLDVSKAYWQTKIRAQDRPLYCFKSNHKVYVPLRTPFGAKNAGATWLK